MTTLNTPTPNPSPDLPGMQQKLRGRLMQLGKRLRSRIALDAFVRGLAVLLGLLALSLVLDFWLELSRPMRVFYWLITLAAAAHFLYHYGIKPLRKKLGPVELAEAVDIAQQNDGVNQLAPRVATVLQLPGMLGDDGALSGNMIHDAVGRSYRSLEQTDFTAALSGKHTMQCVGALLASLLLFGGTGAGMSAAGENVLSTWAQRWLLLSDASYPRNTSIEVAGLSEDGVLVIPAGENATLFTTITTKDGRAIEEARIKLSPANDQEWPKGLDKFDSEDFRLELMPMTGSAKATISAGDQTLRFKIEPAARPRLTGLKLTHTHPADPDNPKTIDFAGAEGEVSLLDLNEVELVLTANVPIAEIRDVQEVLDGDDAGGRPAIQRVSENVFKVKWTHLERQRFRIELVSEGAGLVSQPIPISIGLKTDRKPSVRLRYTGVGQRITPNALIPLTLEARDDYGLVNAKIDLLRIRIGEDAGEETFDPIVLHEADPATIKEFRDKQGLEVDEFGVRPTDVIRLTGVATDNRYSDSPGGGQVGESTKVDFRIVTHKELFREIIARQQQARSAFRQAIEDSKDILLKLREAEDGVQAAGQSRRFRAIQRSVWKVGRELERSAEEMRLNRLGGSKEDGNQAYESMKALILEPLAKLHDQTMSNQRSALEAAANADQVRLDQIRADQVELIDEMNLLLSKMSRWDELLDAINQLSEVIDQQEQLKKKVDELINEQIDDLFDE
ncbi:MAG: hypothetical protein KTR15_01265 [Phycisphaeraceae bacterium]|nr:hypothetical protein [Phycisphaeraceae bacterium]